MTNFERLQELALALPEAHRVDVEAWDGEPTFRVNRKNFVFTDAAAARVTVKLPHEEAEAVVATDPRTTSCGYGLGRHGWVTIELGDAVSEATWVEIDEWIETSYRLVAPKRLLRLLDSPTD